MVHCEYVVKEFKSIIRAFYAQVNTEVRENFIQARRGAFTRVPH